MTNPSKPLDEAGVVERLRRRIEFDEPHEGNDVRWPVQVDSWDLEFLLDRLAVFSPAPVDEAAVERAKSLVAAWAWDHVSEDRLKGAWMTNLIERVAVALRSLSSDTRENGNAD